MAKEQEDVKLGFQVEMETRKALQGLALIDKTLRGVTRKNKVLKWDDKKGFGDFKKRFGDYRKQLRGHQKEMTQFRKAIADVGGKGHANKVSRNFDAYKKSYDKFERDLRTSQKKYREEARKNRAVYHAAETDDARKAADEQLKAHQKLYAKEVNEAKKGIKAKQRALAKGVSGPGSALIMEKHGEQVKARKQSQEQFQEAISNLKTAAVGSDLADGFADTLQTLGNRDLLGAGKAGGRIAAGLMKGTGKLGMKWGRDLQIMGTGMGGKKGSAVAGLGAGLSKLGPLVVQLSKLGPILSMSAGVMMSIIKLLVDVESHAKEMNKQLLEGSSTAEILYKNMGNVNRASKGLSGTLDTIRDQATDIGENFKWGSTKDQIIQVVNALNQQGVTLASLETAFDNVRKSAHKSAADVGNFGDLARTSLAYSRLMGVSLQEITDFQSEMFVELGSSLTDTKLEFARMTREASESGIATNKFFSILRGVSSDLGLYNTRLDQAATLLKVLGKSMNPREAAKFMQFATAGVQKMDQLQRTRISMFAGQDVSKAALKEDFDSKTQAGIVKIASQTGDSVQSVEKLVKQFMSGDDKALDQALAKVPDAARGALVDSFVKMRRSQMELEKGGSLGVGAAMGNASPGAMLSILEQTSKKLFGQNLESVTGEQGLALRNILGVSEEQYEQLVSMRFAMEATRRELESALNGTMNDPKRQAQILAQLQARNITKDNLGSLSTSDLLNISEAVAPETDAAAQMRMAQEQSKLIVSMEDKVGMIVDGIFNYLYKALRSLVEGLHEILNVFGKGGTNVSGTLEGARTGKNATVVDRLQDVAASEFDSARSRQAVLKSLDAGLREGFKQNQTMDRSFVLKDISTLVQGAPQLQKALDISSIDKGKKDKFYNEYLMSGDLQKSATSSNLTDSDLRELLVKSGWTLGTEDLGRIANMGLLQFEEFLPQGGFTNGPPVPGMAAAAGVVPGGAATPSTAPAMMSTPAAPAASSMPESVTPASMPSTTQLAVGMREQTDLLDMTGRETVSNLQNLYDALRRRGIMLDQVQLQGTFKSVIQAGTLQAMRVALFEYAMYSSADQAKLIQRMKDTGLGADLATSYETAKSLPGNALGGDVVGIAAGRAVVASPGEGLASVGRGEKIVPAGRGGGNTIILNVNGVGGADLANLLKTKIAEGIYEYKRREKYQ